MFKIFKRSQPEEPASPETPVKSQAVENEPLQPEAGSSPTGEPTGGEFSSETQLPTNQSPASESPAGGTSPETPAVPPSEPAPATAEPIVTLPRPKSKSVFYFMFSSETRFGRFFRPLLRWLGAITGLFALGLLAGYLLLYQPAQTELDNALLRLNQANQTVVQKDKNQQTAQLDRDQALKALQQAQTDLQKAASQNSLLIVLVDVNNARVALVNKVGATAKTSIEQAQTDLAKVLPYLQSQDKARSDVLQPRLDLVAKELVSDPVAALADLDKLASDLTDLHKKLFQQ